MSSIDKLTQLFGKFPGVGARQARRFVYFLLRSDTRFLEDLTQAITELKSQARQCPHCRRFFVSDKDISLCEVCADQNRDHTVMLVVERESDFETIEKSDVYKGRFFILGGTIPVLEKTPDEKVRTQELIIEVDRAATEDGLTEVVFALSANPEGEHTTDYLTHKLADVAQKHNISIARLGRGLSTGTELEYSDKDTLSHALENRK